MEPAGPYCSSTSNNNSGNTAYNQLITPSNSNFLNELTNSPPLVPTHFLYLPPGLGLTLCKNGESSSGRDDFQLNSLKSRAGMNSSPKIRKSNNNKINTTPIESQDVSNNVTSSSSRKGSFSSSRSNLSFTSQTSTSSTNNSPPSSIESSITSSSTSSRRKTKDSGEDQALYDARRALWDECIAGDDESDRQAVSIFTDTPTDSEVDIETEDDDEEDDPIGQLDEDIDQLDLTPTTSNTIISKPSHATLSPQSSCLRLPSTTSSTSTSFSTSFNPNFFDSSTTSRSSSTSFQPSTSPSSSILSLSSVCTTNSVQFSLEPPQALETYSPEEYERGGDPPLEKLSMRDCIELHRLRECVGLWSGKIKKWEPEVELQNQQQQQQQLESALNSPTIGNISLSGGGGTGESVPAPRTTRLDSYCSLSGMTGVVTLCHSDS